MDIKRLRPGNLIKISPRENEEGLLLIQEIHKESIIGEMLVPRQGYHFRIKFYEIMPIPLNEKWLEKAGFVQDENNGELWRDSNKRMDFYFSGLGQKQFYDEEKMIGKFPVEFLHDLQNGYLFLTGKELNINP
ncbi:hypothetical protein [Pedobacter sp. SYSU D00535]|uniref:hypothetical protein n=1 Tax=Pedobacter sp. SYSU D00535 TaxID=2810308 RepID=UPI001A9582EB|nr:hypothetical protein [Pedobacter sp. SYSU D00535]